MRLGNCCLYRTLNRTWGLGSVISRTEHELRVQFSPVRVRTDFPNWTLTTPEIMNGDASRRALWDMGCNGLRICMLEWMPSSRSNEKTLIKKWIWPWNLAGEIPRETFRPDHTKKTPRSWWLHGMNQHNRLTHQFLWWNVVWVLIRWSRLSFWPCRQHYSNELSRDDIIDWL
jgi:hypothetical protein